MKRFTDRVFCADGGACVAGDPKRFFVGQAAPHAIDMDGKVVVVVER